MSGGGQADERESHVKLASEHREDGGRHASRGEAEGGEACAARRPPPFHQEARQPSAADAPEVRCKIRPKRHERGHHGIHPARLDEIGREPGQVEPPHRVGHHLAEQKRPSLPVAQKRRPRHVHRYAGRIVVAQNELSLGGGQVRMFFRCAVIANPKKDPDEAERSGGDESPLPVPRGREPHDRGGDHDPDVAACVEDASCEGAFALRKPLGDGLDARREIGGFAKPKGEPRNRKPERASRERVADPGEAPDDDCPDHAEAHAELVEQAAGDAEHDGVGELEGEVDPAVARVVPADLLFQDGVQDRHRLSIEVVDGRREEKNPADVPAEVLDGLAGRR